MENQIVIYKNNDGNIECSVNLRDNTLWLSLDQISVVAKFATVQTEG